MVAPLVGARIEISATGRIPANAYVAPLVGARIEIPKMLRVMQMAVVAPLVGARTDILMQDPFNLQVKCRSPRGSAD